MIQPIKVMVVDDHASVREGIAILLEAAEELVLVAEAANGVEAMRLCKESDPDVILMDLVMPEMDGITATQAIHEAYPSLPVVVISGHKDKAMLQKALNAGAAGYLLKNISGAVLTNAIRAAYLGHEIVGGH